MGRGRWPLAAAAVEHTSTFNLISIMFQSLHEAGGRWPGFPCDGCIPQVSILNQLHGPPEPRLACWQPLVRPGRLGEAQSS